MQRPGLAAVGSPAWRAQQRLSRRFDRICSPYTRRVDGPSSGRPGFLWGKRRQTPLHLYRPPYSDAFLFGSEASLDALLPGTALFHDGLLQLRADDVARLEMQYQLSEEAPTDELRS